MKKKLPLLLFTTFTVALVYHLLTLDISPIVKQDEASFNSITDSYKNHGTYYMTDCPVVWGGQESLMYGPVYFWIQSRIVQVFGNGVFQFRLIGMLSGLLVIWLIYFFVVRKLSFDKKHIGYLGLIVLLLDPFFISSMHSGRMDTLGLVFVALSYFALLYLFKQIERANQVSLFAITFVSSLLFTIACLTSSRFILFGFPIALLFLKELIFSRSLRKQIIFSGTFFVAVSVGIYLSWILGKFNSIEAYLQYSKSINTSFTFFGIGKIFIPTEEYPLILLFVALVLMKAVTDLKFFLRNDVLLSLTTLFLFHFVVQDKGPHSAIVLPFYYWVIFLCLSGPVTSVRISRIRYWGGAILLVFNSGVFVLKNTTLIQSYSIRNPRLVERFFADNLPPGSRVVGDFMYHYAAYKADCDFRFTFHDVSPLKTIEKNRREQFDYEYIMISDKLEKNISKIVAHYRTTARLQLVAEFKNPPTQSLSLLKHIHIYKYDFGVDGYSGKLYKRLDAR